MFSHELPRVCDQRACVCVSLFKFVCVDLQRESVWKHRILRRDRTLRKKINKKKNPAGSIISAYRMKLQRNLWLATSWIHQQNVHVVSLPTNWSVSVLKRKRSEGEHRSGRVGLFFVYKFGPPSSLTLESDCEIIVEILLILYVLTCKQ